LGFSVDYSDPNCRECRVLKRAERLERNRLWRQKNYPKFKWHDPSGWGLNRWGS
jgi:hypothetical protein